MEKEFHSLSEIGPGRRKPLWQGGASRSWKTPPSAPAIVPGVKNS
jgi:hypothetical protein